MSRCPFALRHDFEKTTVEDESGEEESATIYVCRRCGFWYARTMREGLRAGRIMGCEESVRRCSKPRGLPG